MDKTSSDHPASTDARLRDLPRDIAGLAVFLDVDGTLLEIAGSPGEVRVEMRLRHMLERLRVSFCMSPQSWSWHPLSCCGPAGFTQADGTWC